MENDDEEKKYFEGYTETITVGELWKRMARYLGASEEQAEDLAERMAKE
jgi:hypothetical protein